MPWQRYKLLPQEFCQITNVRYLVGPPTLCQITLALLSHPHTPDEPSTSQPKQRITFQIKWAKKKLDFVVSDGISVSLWPLHTLHPGGINMDTSWLGSILYMYNRPVLNLWKWLRVVLDKKKQHNLMDWTHCIIHISYYWQTSDFLKLSNKHPAKVPVVYINYRTCSLNCISRTTNKHLGLPIMQVSWHGWCTGLLNPWLCLQGIHCSPVECRTAVPKPHRWHLLVRDNTGEETFQVRLLSSSCSIKIVSLTLIVLALEITT